jgi:protein-arginine kinase activator protein McsA
VRCERCKQREATDTTFIVTHDTNEYWQLCKTCYELGVAENEAAGLQRAQADPAGTMRQMEANLGRALTLEERSAVEEYLARPAGPRDAT